MNQTIYPCLRSSQIHEGREGRSGSIVAGANVAMVFKNTEHALITMAIMVMHCVPQDIVPCKIIQGRTKYKHVHKQREIERETRTAYLNAQTGYSRMASTAREVEAHVKARNGQQRGYDLGAATIVALLEAKKNLLKSRFSHARARYDYIRSVVALRVWGGTLTRMDLEELNSWLARN
jgi:Outer membrane efflux protein